jgi:hypothetical protein
LFCSDKNDLKANSTGSLESEKFVSHTDEGDIIVSGEHPEIQKAVDRALEEATKITVTVPATDYVKVLRAELESLRAQRAKIDPTAPA